MDGVKNSPNYAINIIGVTGIEARKQSGTTGFFIKDLHGDVLYAATASGIPFANYLYDAWGNETTADASAWEKDNPVMFVDPSGLDYDSIINELNNIYFQKNIMNTTEDISKKKR